MLISYVMCESSQIVGILVALEGAINEGEDRGNHFWTKVLQKQHQRVRVLYDRHVVRCGPSFLLLFVIQPL